MRNRKFKSFSQRLTRRLVLTLLIAMGIASFFVFALGGAYVAENEQQLHESFLANEAEEISRVASDVYIGTQNLVPQVEERLNRPDELHMLLERALEQNQRIRSCGISFVENYYPQKGRCYVPYAIRRDSTHVEFKDNAAEHQTYLEEEWFQQGLQAEKGLWTEPFFEYNDSTQPMLIAYVHPIHNQAGRTVAVLGVDVSVDWLREKMKKSDWNVYVSEFSSSGSDAETDSLKLLKRKERWVPYSFLISPTGTFIVHPNRQRIIRDNFSSVVKASEDTAAVASLGRWMMEGKKGFYHVEENSDMADELSLEGKNFYVCFTPIKHTGWSLALAVPAITIDLFSYVVGGVLAFFVLLAVLIVGLVCWRSIRRATKPLKQLAASADEVAKGHFDTPLPAIRHNDEVRLLRDSFANMQHSLTQYMEELKDTTASKAAIENELTIAHNIQMAMLPKIFPPYPNRNDIDIYGMLTPAKAVGGDLFDFYLHDNRLFFCIGDVSGKGVPASLVMAVTRSLFRNVSAHATEPHHIVRALNEAMSEGNESSMFVTLFVGVLELETGLLHYCNAGHDAPLLIASGSCQELPCEPNVPVGIMPGWEFAPQVARLQPDTTVFLYTDGLNEAENAGHEQFEMERIRQVAETLPSSGLNTSETLVKLMAQAVAGFVGDAEQSDDLTMLAIRFLPGK